MDRSPTAHDALEQTTLHPGFAMFLVLASALLVLSTACDSGTQEPEAPASQTRTAAPGEQDSASAAAPRPRPSGSSIAAERFPTDLPEGVTAEIPANLPASIPIYPGAQPAQGMGSTRGDGQDVAGVQLLSNDPVSDIFAYYEGELKANGWEIIEANNDGATATLNATNGNAKAAFFIATSPQGGSDIFMISEN